MAARAEKATKFVGGRKSSKEWTRQSKAIAERIMVLIEQGQSSERKRKKMPASAA